MANKTWNDMFNYALCNAMAAVKSDHSPLHICMQNLEYGRGRRNRVFRYEAAWELKEECGGIVKEVWSKVAEGTIKAGMIRSKLEQCKRGLISWKQKTIQQDQRDISRDLASISHLQDTGDGSHMVQIAETSKES
ncbi:uncharacterized protein LOC118348759 [Juglans regia]|uniref:Uncharacterized protein LOC118348759 n=1 Tax=Juglans regia TaxID=51240 RepID=A0A6P9EHR4_JUGRE|nr:uncharacterized protein LOC118348759 [Juglans regia]